MSDESNGRGGWIVERGCPIYEYEDGLRERPYGSQPDDGEPARALVALIEAAESTEPRNQPEPLPLMTGREIAVALHAGKRVEVRCTSTTPCWGDPPEWRDTDPAKSAWWLDEVGQFSFVARVVEPPAPATERVPWPQAFDYRKNGQPIVRVDGLPGGSVGLIGARGEAVEVDADGTVEVLTEGTDKP